MMQIEVPMAFVPGAGQLFNAFGLKLERRYRSAIILIVDRIGGKTIDVRRQALRHAIIIELAEIVVERAVLLQHINDVVDRADARFCALHSNTDLRAGTASGAGS